MVSFRALALWLLLLRSIRSVRLTKNVEDSAYVLQAIAGHDRKDSTSANVEIPDYRQRAYR